jgi:cell wall-associated NlpC family hydrolase
MSTATRTDVVAAARSWLGTPFHHQARLQGVGVDCVGLVIGVARTLGLVPPGFDVQAYPRMPDGKSLMHLVHLHMRPLQIDQPMQPGDVVVVRFDADPQHLGILGDYRHGGLSIIHAAATPGRVIETRLLFTPSMQYVAAFALPGIEG